MSVIALPLDPSAQARALLHHLLEAGDVIVRDAAGRTVIQLAAEDWLLEQLLNFDAGFEDLEDEAEANEVPAVLSFDRVTPRQVYRCRQYLGSRSTEDRAERSVSDDAKHRRPDTMSIMPGLLIEPLDNSSQPCDRGCFFHGPERIERQARHYQSVLCRADLVFSDRFQEPSALSGACKDDLVRLRVAQVDAV